jgi:hypothetical protein
MSSETFLVIDSWSINLAPASVKSGDVIKVIEAKVTASFASLDRNSLLDLAALDTAPRFVGVD